MVPLNTTNDKAQLLAGVFGCKLESLPFTYLGLPMGTTKPRVEHYGPIMNRTGFDQQYNLENPNNPWMVLICFHETSCWYENWSNYYVNELVG
jgi:hypothetical protein